MVYEGSTAHCQSSPGELLLSRESQWWSLTELGAEVWVAHSEDVSRARLLSWARGVPGKGSARAEKGLVCMFSLNSICQCCRPAQLYPSSDLAAWFLCPHIPRGKEKSETPL